MRYRRFWSGTTQLGTAEVEQCVLEGAPAGLPRLVRRNVEFSRPGFDGFGTAELPTVAMRAQWSAPMGHAVSNCDVLMYDRPGGTLVEVDIEAVNGGGANAKKMAKRVVERLREVDPALR